MNADGQGVGRLSQSWSQAPYTWSPDGQWIVYAKDFFSSATLYIMDSFGVNSTAIAGNNTGFHPVWRP
jgi:Tol biopolymer transport system component